MERKEIYLYLFNGKKSSVCDLAAGLLDVIINCRYEKGLNDYADGWNESRESLIRLFTPDLQKLGIL